MIDAEPRLIAESMEPVDSNTLRSARSFELDSLEAKNTFVFVIPAKTPRIPKTFISTRMIL